MKIGTDMEWRALESSMFVSSAYDAGKHLLYLRFQSGEVYRYFDIPAEQYEAFLKAESHGRFFLNHIRNRFPYQRLAKLQAA